ncbi:MAG: AAA family ATPase [Deltaproteobacteria bacterium]|nr:AAA family ATPase [Deltaproteobacteria bacterium]
MSAARFWKEVHHWFDPTEPVGADQPELHAERDPRYNPLVRLADELRLTDDHCRVLLTGAIGNGKTSELNFFATSLTKSRIVVLVDLWEHVQNNVRDPNALNRMEMWELLGLLGVAIYQAGKEHLGHVWGEEPKALEGALKRLRAAEGDGSEAEIDLVELGHGMTVAAGGVAGAMLGAPVGAAIGAAGKGLVKAVADAAKWTWKVGLPGTRHRGDQDGDVRLVLDAVNQLILGLRADYDRPLLLVIDGLDRITDSERTRLLFIDSLLLSMLECDELSTAPLMLMREQSTLVDRFFVKDLHNIPVLDRNAPNDPTRMGPGIAFFRELVDKRITRIKQLLVEQGLTCPADPLPGPVVDRLAYYSGGLVRDFVKLVRLVVFEALRDDLAQVTDEIVDRALREARSDKEFYMSKRGDRGAGRSHA